MNGFMFFNSKRDSTNLFQNHIQIGETNPGYTQIPITGIRLGPCVSVERIGDFCKSNPVQYIHCVLQSELNPVVLSKHLIQSGLYPKKL